MGPFARRQVVLLLFQRIAGQLKPACHEQVVRVIVDLLQR